MNAFESTYATRRGSKVMDSHLERLALVYIRQSTPQQMVQHQESTRIQYALKERALSLGWESHRIEVIDEDLGQSGASVEGRYGFQRLLAEVSLNHVGIILGVEVSRFARSCRDWYQLLDVCALFGTLIADVDGVYDPAAHNDRLLLGLKGTMSEAELHLLKRRMQDGRQAKAQRGDLAIPVPLGYVRRPSGEVTKDPDERARSVVETIFHQFTAIGTIRGVLRYLVRNGLMLPVREREGPSRGELSWHRPNGPTISRILHNPTYAGAYAFGRRLTDQKRKKPGRPGSGRSSVPPEQWAVLLQGLLPAYITWEDFLHNGEQMRNNTPKAKGAVRKGSLLLVGLVVCGRCGRRMRGCYSQNGMWYVCKQGSTQYADPICQSLAGPCLDQEVERQVLAALEPAALEISMAVAADMEARRAEEETHWRQRLGQAQYEAERAHRQYDAVEPENRMVARTLERIWEEGLQSQKVIVEAYERYRATASPTLAWPEREAIQELAENLPGIWFAPTTTPADRKAIIRQLVDWVRVMVVGKSEQVHVTIGWAGGRETEAAVARPVKALDQLSYLNPLLERIQALREQGRTSKEVAQVLNEEGWRPSRQKGLITADWVRTVFSRHRPAEGRRDTKGDSPKAGLRKKEKKT